MGLLALSGTSHGGEYKVNITTTNIATTKTNTGRRRITHTSIYSSNAIISNNCLEYVESIKKSQYVNTGGLFATSKEGTLTFQLLKFSNSKDTIWPMDMDNGKLDELVYSMIIVRDLSLYLGIIMILKCSLICWGEDDMPMNRT